MKSVSILKRALLAGATLRGPVRDTLVQAGVLVINSISGEAVTINYNGANQGTIAGAFSGTFDGNPLTWWCVDLAKHVTVPEGSLHDYTAAPFKAFRSDSALAGRLISPDFSPTIFRWRCPVRKTRQHSRSRSGTYSSTTTAIISTFGGAGPVWFKRAAMPAQLPSLKVG